jgi:hypothetical protein
MGTRGLKEICLNHGRRGLEEFFYFAESGKNKSKIAPNFQKVTHSKGFFRFYHDT